MNLDSEDPCPCASGLPLQGCCAPFVEGTLQPPTAEALMRSRYTGYVLERFDYIRASWHPETCPADLQAAPRQRWLGLKIIRTENGLADDLHGIVEFVARSKRDGRAQRLHEISEFERLNGQWVYRRGRQVVDK